MFKTSFTSDSAVKISGNVVIPSLCLTALSLKKQGEIRQISQQGDQLYDQSSLEIDRTY
jgi:hypothetical protein